MKDFGTALMNPLCRALCRALALAAFLLPAAAAVIAEPLGAAGDFRKTVVVAGVARS